MVALNILEYPLPLIYSFLLTFYKLTLFLLLCVFEKMKVQSQKRRLRSRAILLIPCKRLQSN